MSGQVKDFSYMFYPGDVLRDTQFFNEAQKGCYLTFLTCHIEKICFSYEFIMKVTTNLSEIEKKELLEIFTKNEDGKYVIQWVYDSINKRSNYLKSRANNKKKEKNNTSIDTKKEISYEIHMVNEDEKEKEYINKKEKEIKSEFENFEISEKWDQWKKYKKTQFKFSYKSDDTELTAIRELKKISNKNIELAKKIINQSITNGWKGLFELNESKTKSEPIQEIDSR